MTNEEKAQLALGLKFECAYCKKVFSTNNRYATGVLNGTYYGILLGNFCKGCVHKQIIRKHAKFNHLGN